jgi:hypothetical protein
MTQVFSLKNTNFMGNFREWFIRILERKSSQRTECFELPRDFQPSWNCCPAMLSPSLDREGHLSSP